MFAFCASLMGLISIEHAHLRTRFCFLLDEGDVPRGGLAEAGDLNAQSSTGSEGAFWAFMEIRPQLPV